MGTANSGIEGWKYTREGRKAHYFQRSKEYADVERSLCGYSYHESQLDDVSTIRSKCRRCEKRFDALYPF